jgi:BirA family biotin operon repressor/biotin-[acetyl-CoA-carboxylase] ligase
MSRPDWHLEELWLKLVTLWPGITIEWLPEIDSTNSELMRRAREGRADPVLLVAEQQTAGRGRMGRSWVTPEGSALTFSLGLPLKPAHWSGLSLAVGVTLIEALDPEGRLGLGLKWPNDLWHWPSSSGPAKLGGILIETLQVPGTAEGRYAVVGVGINLITPDIDTGAIPPIGLDHWDAVSSVGTVLAAVAPGVLQTLAAFEQRGPSAWLARFDRLDLLRGRTLHTSQGVQGLGAGIDEEGALLLQTKTGQVRVDSSEVSVRPLKLEP